MIYECFFFSINRAVARLHYLAEDAIQVTTSPLLNLLNIRMWLPEQFNNNDILGMSASFFIL